MRANELLLWLSARHEGSWQQFRQAVEGALTNNPITEIAIAPKIEVVVMPMSASRPDGSIAPHFSVMKAGKWAVIKPN